MIGAHLRKTVLSGSFAKSVKLTAP